MVIELQLVQQAENGQVDRHIDAAGENKVSVAVGIAKLSQVGHSQNLLQPVEVKWIGQNVIVAAKYDNVGVADSGQIVTGWGRLAVNLFILRLSVIIFRQQISLSRHQSALANMGQYSEGDIC